MRFRALFVCLPLLGLAHQLFGATITSKLAGGNWSVGTSWVGNVAPVAGDDVVISDGSTIFVDNSFTINSIVVDGTGILSFTAGAKTLTVTTNVTLGGATVVGPAQIIGSNNNQQLDVTGSFNVAAARTGTVGGCRLTVTGTTNINGYFAFANSGVGNKFFNNTITVAVGGTWDNLVGEDPRVNCNIVNNGSWPAPSGGNGRYQVSVNGTSYTYSGSQPINMTILDLTNGTGTTITNLGTLALHKNGGGNTLTVGNGRSFINGDGVSPAVLQIYGTADINNAASGTIDFSPANNTVDYIGAADQNVYATTYHRLWASTSGTKTLLGTTTVNNGVSTSGSAILDANTRTFDGAASLVMTGTSQLLLAKIGVTLPELTGTVNSLGVNTSISFNGAGAQTAKGSSATNPSTTNTYPYQHVNLNGNNAASNVNFTSVSLINGNLTFTNLGKMNSNPVLSVLGTFNFGPGAATTTLANNITVGNIIFSGGTLNYSNRSIIINGVNGTWTNNGGATLNNNATSLVSFITGTNQQITGTTTTVFPNLTINNVNGVTLNGVDAQVQNTLTFTIGNLITGASTIYASGPVSRTSGHVVGNLQKDIGIGSPSVTFEVGTGATYAPVNVVFTAVTTAGTLTCSSTSGDHPDINASNIEPNKTANRYWSLTNSGIIFTSYNSTFNFAGGIPVDLDASATPANFIIKRLNGLTWFTTTVGTRTGTSTQFTGEPAANLPTLVKQEFQCGELIVTSGIFSRLTGTSSWNNKATWIENRTGTITFTAASIFVTGVGTLFLTELADGDVLMLQTSAGVVQGFVAAGGRTSNTTLTLTVGAVGGSGGYGRQRIPNAIGDVVTVGNSNIADATTTINFDMPVATLINTLNINTAAAPRTTSHNVTHITANALTIQTAVNVNQPGGNATDAWNINAGTATVNGNLTIGTAVNNNLRIAQVSVTTGTLTTGNLTFDTFSAASNELTAVLDMSGGAGRINVLGQLNFTNNLGRLIPGTTSTFNFQRSASSQQINWPSANQNATKWIYNNLRLNNTSSAGAFIQAGDDITVATNGTINVTGDLRVETGLFLTSNNTDITGSGAKTFQIDPGATFSMTGANSTFPTGFGTFSMGTTTPFGLVSYEQSNNVTVASPAGGYGSLRFLNNSTATLPATLGVAGHLVVGNGSTAPTLRGNSTTSFTVTNDVTINTGGTINASANGRIRSFNIGGNWSNSGTFTPSTNAGDAGVVFTGAGPVQPQTIGGTTADDFYNFEINTGLSTHLVQLLKSISVSNVATFTLGGLALDAYTLSITNKSTTSVVRTGGYVKSEKTSAPYGTISWHMGNLIGTFVYPFGKSSTEYIPFTMITTSAGGPNNGPTMAVSTYATATNNTPFPTTVTNLNGTAGGNSVVDRFWVITETGFTTRPTATITFTAVGGSAPILTPPSERPGSIADLTTVAASPAGIAAQRWSPALTWDVALPGQTFANNSPAANFFQVTVPGVNNFSPWALADISAPLPIELIDFTAEAGRDFVSLHWKTETELDNDYFLVQKTRDAEIFEDVVSVKGAGTSISSKSYIAFDYKPSPGKLYYRLKQVDFDGHYSYSKLVTVEISESLFWTIYPNPGNGSELTINLSLNDIGKSAAVKIQDLNGKELALFTTDNVESREIKITIPDKLPSGLYIISIAVEQQVVRQKLVVR